MDKLLLARLAIDALCVFLSVRFISSRIFVPVGVNSFATDSTLLSKELVAIKKIKMLLFFVFLYMQL